MQKSKTGDKWDTYGDNAPRRKWLIGIDEVGRGPLAGPVTVGAVAVLIGGSVDDSQVSGIDEECDGTYAGTYEKIHKKLMEISGKEYPIGVDSKKMKEKDRDFWFDIFGIIERTGTAQENETFENDETQFYTSVQHMSAAQIDEKGIAVCIAELVDLNIRKILGEIQVKNPDATYENFYVLLDGGLKTGLPVGSQKTIIKGDEKELLISLASVNAKVTRDRHMEELSKNSKYAGYGFEVHKGYGTLKHREAIKKLGPSDQHRVSFCKNILSN